MFKKFQAILYTRLPIKHHCNIEIKNLCPYNDLTILNFSTALILTFRVYRGTYRGVCLCVYQCVCWNEAWLEIKLRKDLLLSRIANWQLNSRFNPFVEWSIIVLVFALKFNLNWQSALILYNLFLKHITEGKTGKILFQEE